MTYPKIIQGGMGVAVSSWKLAQTVSKLGQLGVVSGTGVGIVLIARLMDGDENSDMRRALDHFPQQDVADRIYEKYYIEGGKPQGKGYKRPTLWTAKPRADLEELTVVANFVEVWLAKEGHNNPVGINLLEKVQMPTMSSLYGAMLADVDYVIMGAGIPTQVPGILDDLAEHKAVKYRLDVNGEASEEELFIHFDPQRSFAQIPETVATLKRPDFFPIISSVVLGKALQKRSSGEVNGFIVELPTAGGHNAPPRTKNNFNDDGEPVYTEKDEVSLEKIAKMGLPFWVAGGYGHADKLQEALDAGAQGIQVGTAFAFCDESGMTSAVRASVIKKVREKTVKVFTDPLASPTGFPFKVVELDETASNSDIYMERPRICDIGYLRQLYRDDTGKIHYRCASEPVNNYLKKDGEEENTVGRKCLCNHLGASAGFPQTHVNGYVEQPIVTSGDDLVGLEEFISADAESYSAADVINTLLALDKA